jgi:hypothetical protein
MAVVSAIHQTAIGRCNNFDIFRSSFVLLVSGQNLYVEHKSNYWDLYKYSPTFAVWMAPWAYMPKYLGAVCWNVVNAMGLFAAICCLPLKSKSLRFVLAFAALETLTCLQNMQSNALVAAGVLWTYVLHENKRNAMAGIVSVGNFFVKIFGGAAAILSLLYRQSLFYYLAAGLSLFGLAALPLFWISPSDTVALYHSWYRLLRWDADVSTGQSVFGWLDLLNIKISANVVRLAGIILLIIPPFLAYVRHSLQARILYLAVLLLSMVVFNHKAESPTFVIAVVGVALYAVVLPRTPMRILLLAAVVIFTQLSPTDIFPSVLRHEFVLPYKLKALPCIIVWMDAYIQLVKPK